MVQPATLAFGGEYRKNTYQIGSGDAASIYKEGGQSYPGFRPSDAGVHSRENEAGYVDVALMPFQGLKLDGAVRYEHYSDFGSKVIYKGTARYDFSPAFALRGTVATGFRAPTLAESYYSATNVSPTSAFVQLPANSAAAKLIGFDNLKPEKSTNYSVGTVIRPISRLTITVDAYQVKIRDRILGTGSLYGSGGGTLLINGTSYSANFPIVTSAIRANGNVLDPTVTQTGINIFTNGADTRTRGVDVVASYQSDFGNYGSATWTLSGNYNTTKLTRLSLAPAALTPTGAPGPVALFDAGAVSNIETSSPKVKAIASVFYALDKFSMTLRETVYGKSSVSYSPDGGTFYPQRIGTAGITDVEVNYKLVKGLELSFGANNVFNKKPPTIQVLAATVAGGQGTVVNGGNVYDAPLTFSPYGINGGYYYGRLSFKF
jgi:iron complex outermembrane receptor protein